MCCLPIEPWDMLSCTFCMRLPGPGAWGHQGRGRRYASVVHPTRTHAPPSQPALSLPPLHGEHVWPAVGAHQLTGLQQPPIPTAVQRPQQAGPPQTVTAAGRVAAARRPACCKAIGCIKAAMLVHTQRGNGLDGASSPCCKLSHSGEHAEHDVHAFQGVLRFALLPYMHAVESSCTRNAMSLLEVSALQRCNVLEQCARDLGRMGVGRMQC